MFEQLSPVSVLVVFGAFGIAGCSQKEASKPVSDTKTAQTGSDQGSSEAQEVSESANASVLSLGEKGQNKIFEVVAEKVTATGSLSSFEATALLQKDGTEAAESSSAPAQSYGDDTIKFKVRQRLKTEKILRFLKPKKWLSRAIFN